MLTYMIFMIVRPLRYSSLLGKSNFSTLQLIGFAPLSTGRLYEILAKICEKNVRQISTLTIPT